MVVNASSSASRVRRAALAWLTLLLIGAGSALGAPGEALVVAKDKVNMRQGPGTEHAVVTTLALGQAVTEIARNGEWVNVKIGGATNQSGWVHQALLAVPQGQPASKTATAAPNPDFALLESAVQQLNTVALNQGYAFFSAVRDLGNGGAEVVATEQWLALPEGFRTSNFNALTAVWQGAAGLGGPNALRIVDAEGNVVMETPAQMEDEDAVN